MFMYNFCIILTLLFIIFPLFISQNFATGDQNPFTNCSKHNIKLLKTPMKWSPEMPRICSTFILDDIKILWKLYCSLLLWSSY